MSSISKKSSCKSVNQLPYQSLLHSEKLCSCTFTGSEKKTGTMALICELMDMNIYELIKGLTYCLIKD